MPDRPVKVVEGGPAFYVKDPKPLKVDPAVKGQATKRRKAWEASEAGQKRLAPPAAMSGPGAGAPGMTRETYRHMGWGDTDISPHHDEHPTLPGMGSLKEARDIGLVEPTGGHGALPDTVATPRWHHLSNGEKMNVEAHAAKNGVTRASAKAAYAANLDQSYDTAHAAGYRPHAEGFYTDPSDHMPLGKLLKAAKETGTTVSEMTTGTAGTSPKTKWGPVRAAGQEGRYPNIAAARHAALHAGQTNIPPATYEDGGKVSVMHGNVERAAAAIHQQQQGVAAADLRSPAGNPVFGGPSQQKTTPFRNAFVDAHGPRSMLVSDIHTGYRGFAPHLGTTEGENYLDHPGVKAWHDHIAREVHAERGIASTNVGQAAQWGQAQLDSGEVKHDVAFPKHGPGPTTTAVPRPEHAFPTPHNSSQMSMFDDPHPAAAHLAAAHEQQPWTMGDQMRHENTVAKRRKQGKGITPDPDALKAGW